MSNNEEKIDVVYALLGFNMADGKFGFVRINEDNENVEVTLTNEVQGSIISTDADMITSLVDSLNQLSDEDDIYYQKVEFNLELGEQFGADKQ